MKVLYISHLLEKSGWGQASRDILHAMDIAGIDVVPRVVRMSHDIAIPSQREKQLLDKTSSGCDVVIQHVLPHLYQYDGNFKKNIGMYYAETGNLRQTSYYSYLNMMDELWVPSTKMQHQARESGVNKPIYKIPHPFNLDKYKKKYTPLEIAECNGEYVFYFIGEAIRRKHLTALLRAFHTEFSFNEPVQLVIKANRSGLTEAQCSEFINTMCHTVKENLKIYHDINRYKSEIIITSPMSDEQICQLHTLGNCLVIPSSGEAINLPAMDAIGFGNKVISTAGQGADEFISHFDNGWLVSSTKSYCFGMTEGFSDMCTGIEECDDISIIELCQAMRWMYENREQNKMQINHLSSQAVGLIIKGKLYESS